MNTDSFDIHTSDYLPNGAQILQREYTERGWVMLCKWHGYQPYVTWRVDDAGNAYWGTYRRELIDAATDFQTKLEELTGRQHRTLGDLIMGH